VPEEVVNKFATEYKGFIER
jgi:hypothetical protein